MGRFFYEMTPETKKENIIIFNDVRISVLLPNLLRIEKQQFTDDATQIVINREFAVNKFKKGCCFKSKIFKKRECC